MNSDDLTLRVSTSTRVGRGYELSNTRVLGGWEEVRFTRGIERCPSDFLVKMTDRYPIATRPDMQVQPGDYCEVFLGGDRVSTGWVDRFVPSFTDGAHSVTLVGRSKCQDIVDCAAVFDGFQLTNASALYIAQTLCAPFGIKASLAEGTNQGAPIEQVVIIAGESTYDILERVCRYRGLLLYDTPSGDLLLSGIGLQAAASGFQEGVNIGSAVASYSMDQKFSDYYAIYQGLDQFSDVGGAPNQIAHLVDESVPRYRPRVVLSENLLGGSMVAEDRAKWEMSRRQGRSFFVRLNTDSWRDSSGALYTPNTMASLAIPSLKLGSEASPVSWLIAETTYNRGRAGTTCDVLLMPPQAFYQQPFIWAQFAPDQVVG